MPNGIRLTSLHSNETEKFVYRIGNEFFAEREKSLINGGTLDVEVALKKEGTNSTFRGELTMRGEVVVNCDRCLADLTCPVEQDVLFKVELGERDEVKDDIIVVEETVATLDVDALVYDYAVLALPMHPVHPEGECNEDVVAKLKEYLVQEENLVEE